MGTSFQSVAIHTSDGDEVKSLLLSWLSAKGFDPRPDQPLFECDDAERGLCLFWNDKWTVVLYSDMIHEGERLIFELGKLGRPVLQMSVFDSDVWGYDLYLENELALSFNSNPSYFGRFVEPTPSNSDPTLLCQVCPVDVKEQDIAKIQRGRALFKEGLCREFCQALGVEPAGVGFRDIEEASLTQGLCTLGGFRMEEMYFVSRDHRTADERTSLHDLRVAPLDRGISAEGEQSALPPDLRTIALLFRIVSWIIRPVFFVLVLLLRFYLLVERVPFIRRLLSKQRPIHESRFLADLYELQTLTSRLEGRVLINDRHRCRITLPEGVEPHIGQDRLLLFAIRVDNLEVMVRALRPSQLQAQLRLGAGMVLMEDSKFFVGALPARLLLFKIEQPKHGATYHYTCYLKAPPAIYHSSFMCGEPISAETLARLRAVADSFE